MADEQTDYVPERINAPSMALSRRIVGVLSLGLVCLAIGFCWLVLFPQWGAAPGFRAAVQLREEQGVVLSAMYYTELDVWKKQTAISRLNQDNPWALWWPWELPVKASGEGAAADQD